MDFLPPFIASREALSDACRLIAQHGDNAAFQAGIEAEVARDKGNVHHFCHWRQIERLVVTLSADEPVGTVH